MNIFFEILCSLTVAGSIVSVCILALRLIPGSVFPTKWLYRLGKLAILFYLFPVSLGLSWLLDIAFQTTSTIPGTENRSFGRTCRNVYPGTNHFGNLSLVLVMRMGHWSHWFFCMAGVLLSEISE